MQISRSSRYSTVHLLDGAPFDADLVIVDHEDWYLLRGQEISRAEGLPGTWSFHSVVVDARRASSRRHR